MPQINSGLRSLLSKPYIYDLFQKILGADKFRRQIVSEFILPNKKDRILDIGCGTARILDFLPESIGYYGFDINQDYINAAKSKFSNRGIFFCANLDESYLKTFGFFDTILAIGILHHLNNDDSKKLIELAKKNLKPGGKFISIDACLISNQNPLAKFIIMRDRGQNIRTPKGYQSLTNGIFSKVKTTLRHQPFIPYTHWIMECKK
jgi:SAM-dependent methyltransferase